MKQHLPLALLVLAACKGDTKSSAKPETTPPSPPTAVKRHDALPRPEFNRWAVRENLPVYWIADVDNDGDLDPDELADLLFYPTSGQTDFETAYDRIVGAAKAPPTTDERQRLVGLDLDQGRATLVRTDLTTLSNDDKMFVRHMLEIARLIDGLYAQQDGAAAVAAQVAPDPASQSLSRRNRGPRCVGPATEKEAACSAIPGAPKPIVGVYPAAMQADEKFCKTLEARKDAEALLTPFTVVTEQEGKLAAVPYTVAYAEPMKAIATELTAAADAIKDPTEAPLVAYLRAAAASFGSNDWQPADEAWAKMNAENSKWYVRVAPDEVYWEPCAHKAGFHLTFARINQGSLEWQKKLVPVQQDMEAAVAAHAGKPYVTHKVTFHLPDFIDIIVNAGDDRTPLGATIGQSLPNWGPVANEGRGRTVAMSNLYGDPDSIAARRSQAETLLDAASMAAYSASAEPGLLNTILHEATHNLGPAHEYKVKGKTDDAIFGGPLASVFEELKAQTGALFLLEFVRSKGLISDELARQTYVDGIVWAFGHISQGMYTGSGNRKAYGNLAAIQVGFLMDHGALTWDDNAMAANGKDKGAFTIHLDKIVPVVDEMMTTVAGIKARGDKAAAEALAAKYVDGKVVPHAIISERVLRLPKASFVYSVSL